MEDRYVLVLVSAGSREEARMLARTMVEKRQAACATVVGPAASFYWWRGHLEEAEEYLVLAKTRRDRLDSLMEIVRERHSYEVPEIIAVPIASGLPEYLAWIDGEIGGNKGEGGGPS